LSWEYKNWQKKILFENHLGWTIASPIWLWLTMWPMGFLFLLFVWCFHHKIAHTSSLIEWEPSETWRKCFIQCVQAIFHEEIERKTFYSVMFALTHIWIGRLNSDYRYVYEY
jgi:hypothetical protein